MKTKTLATFGFVVAAAMIFTSGCTAQVTTPAPLAKTPAPAPDPATVAALLNQITEGNAALTTLSADFAYTVTSSRRQQRIAGKVRLMKPNFARITFDTITEPAFPNVVASDGARLHTFTPANYRPRRTFIPPAVINSSTDAA